MGDGEPCFHVQKWSVGPARRGCNVRGRCEGLQVPAWPPSRLAVVLCLTREVLVEVG